MLIIERIEGDLAVCELGGSAVELPLASLPGDISPGDVCYEGEGGWVIDSAATAARREDAARRYRELFGRHGEK